MYSLRLRLSKIRDLKIVCLKTKTKSHKLYFDYEIKTMTKISKIKILTIRLRLKQDKRKISKLYITRIKLLSSCAQSCFQNEFIFLNEKPDKHFYVLCLT
jgi:hypothetical protein